MKVAIFGDSFGVQKKHQPFASWVDLLACHHDIKNYCECGVGEYKILKQLRAADLRSFDKILIVHTSATRTFVRHNPLHQSSQYHKNCDIILSDVESGQDEFSLACRSYFKHIFDIEYAIDLHHMFCKEIDYLCREHSTIHTTHFDYTGLYQFSNMINFHKLFLKHRGPVCHYDQQGNIEIYNTLVKEL